MTGRCAICNGVLGLLSPHASLIVSPHRNPDPHTMNLSGVLGVFVGVNALFPHALAAQYALAPSPPLDFTRLSTTLRLAGYVATRVAVRSDTSTFSVQRARLTAEIQPLPIAALRVQSDFAAIGRTTVDTVPSFTLADAYVQISPPESSSYSRRFRPALLIGQFKTPFALEYLTSFSSLRTASRSQAVDRLATRRDIGVMGQVHGWNRVILAAALVNGEGSNRPANPNDEEMVIGRLTLLPPLLRLAAAGKWLAHGSDHRWGADVRWLANPVWLPGSVVVEGELIRRAGPLSNGIDTDASGGYALAAWRALPWLEPVVKWEKVREERSTATTRSEATLTWTTYGVILRSPEDREYLRLQLNWVTKTERPVAARNELQAQLILQF